MSVILNKHSSEKSNNNFITTKEAASLTSYSSAYITRLAQKGLIDSRRNAKRWLINLDSLQAYIKAKDIEKHQRREMLRVRRYEEIFIIRHSLKPIRPVFASIQSLVIVFLGLFLAVLISTSDEYNLNMAKIKGGLAYINQSLTEEMGFEYISQTANILINKSLYVDKK